MTAIIAALLVGVAIAIISRPLLTRSAFGRGRATAAAPGEIEERYRSALADIQDAQNDWEIGNLTEADYARFRDEGRVRAAEALRELSIVAEQREAMRRQIELELAARRPATPATANGRADLAYERRFDPGPRRSALFVAGGAALTAIVVGGIIVLYTRQVGIQAAQAPVGALPPPAPRAVLVDAAGGYWAAHLNGVMRSADGKTWSSIGPSVETIAIATKDGRPWLALGPKGALATNDGGDTWTATGGDLPSGDVGGAQSGSDAIYAYFGNAGLFRTTDGASWDPMADPVPERVIGLAELPGSQGGEMLYLIAGGRIIRSPDGGRTWSAASGAVNLSVTGTVRAIAADASRGALYAASSDGIFKSTRDGTEWDKLPFRGSASAVAARGDRMIAVDDNGHVFVSKSGGVSWTADE